MIVGSLLLALGAVALLVIGLAGGDSPYLIGSIAASLLAATVLVAGGRRTGGEEVVDGDQYADGDGSAPPGDGFAPPGDGFAPPDDGAPHPRRARTGQVLRGGVGGADGGDDAGEGHDAGDGHDDRGGFADRDNLGGLEVATGPGDLDVLDDEEQPDEPVAQRVSASDAARLAGLDDEVLVIDGRPRYHRPGCVHLLTRTSEPLPVREAVELGFTPCGLCEPASALLAERSRA